MIEIRDKTVHTVVTIKTGTAKGQLVCRHKTKIHLTVTIVARLQIELGYIDAMAVSTDERLIPGCYLMTT
jgi:hypothetical protein